MAGVLLSQKKSMEDPDFGRLQWSDELDCWTGRFAVASHSFHIFFDDAREISKKARETALRLPEMLPDIEDAIVKEMLELYNVTWRDEGMPVLTRDEFLEAIEPDAIYVGPTGFVTMYWKDGPQELFGGHWIEVRIEEDGTISEVVLAG
jgi:hypothetical protein